LHVSYCAVYILVRPHFHSALKLNPVCFVYNYFFLIFILYILTSHNFILPIAPDHPTEVFHTHRRTVAVLCFKVWQTKTGIIRWHACASLPNEVVHVWLVIIFPYQLQHSLVGAFRDTCTCKTNSRYKKNRLGGLGAGKKH